MTFYKRGLEYQANDKEALRYLRTINANYLSDEIKSKIAELEAEEAAVLPATDSPSPEILPS